MLHQWMHVIAILIFLLQDVCKTEANIHLQTVADFEGAIHCHLQGTGQSTWIYFTTGTYTGVIWKMSMNLVLLVPNC